MEAHLPKAFLPRLNPLMYLYSKYSTQIDVLHTFRTTPCANVGLLHPLDQLIVTSRTDNLFPFTPPRMSLFPGTFSQLYIPCGSHHQALSSKSAHATLKTPPFLPVPILLPAPSHKRARSGSTGLTNYLARTVARNAGEFNLETSCTRFSFHFQKLG